MRPNCFFLSNGVLKGVLFLFLFYIVLFLSFITPCQALAIDDRNAQLTICIDDPVHKLDPAIHRSRNIQIILKNILDSLTTRDDHMKVVPQLAESWKALDETTWEFKLRKDVKFHNLDDFTAEDVKFSLERIFRDKGLNGETSPRKSLLGLVSEVNIIDRYTIEIKTEKPWPILPLMLSLQEIVPKNYMKSVGSDGFQLHPVGTGPFKFVKLEKDTRIILERFDNYYGGSPSIPPVQKAPLKSLVFQYVPSKAKQIRMLKKNECSIISKIDPSALPILKDSPDIQILSVPATRSYFADINCRKPPFDDPQIRQALNHAVDINKIVKQFSQGEGFETLSTLLLPASPAYNNNLTPYPYDPEFLKQKLKNIDFNLNRKIQIHSTKDHLAFANNIAAFLTRAGLNPTITLVKFRKPGLIGKEAPWDIYLGAWGNSTLDPVGIILPKFQTNGRGNYSGYSNHRVDELLSKAESTSDLNFRTACYKKIQEIVYEDAPMIFGYSKKEFFGVRKEVINFIPNASGMMNMHDVYIEKGPKQ